MSWSSTALYYDHINRGIAQRLGGLHSALLAIESVDFAQIAAMEFAGDWDGIAKITIDAARRLEASGAEGLLLACNTVHKSYDAVAANVNVPVLHIADAAADRLVADGRTRVALLGSRFTMTEGFVRDRIERRGTALAPIEAGWMAEVDRIIYEELGVGRVVREAEDADHRACQAEGPGSGARLHRAGAGSRRPR
jgi:aspartate racemase